MNSFKTIRLSILYRFNMKQHIIKSPQPPGIRGAKNNVHLHIKMVLVVYLVTAITASPIQALVSTKYQSASVNNQYIALSWGDIWTILQRRRTPGGGRGEICNIVPQALVSSDNKPVNPEILSDKPLFIWRLRAAQANKILIFETGRREVFETITVNKSETKALYQGKPLQPGQTYTWQLIVDTQEGATIKSTGSNFKLIDTQKRLDINKDLTALEKQLRQQGADAEKIALQKADYFAQKGLWSDVIQQLYSAPKPSQNLTQTIKQIEAHNFCNNQQTATRQKNQNSTPVMLRNVNAVFPLS